MGAPGGAALALTLCLLASPLHSARAAAPAWIGGARPKATVARVVTIAPSLTETMFALGRGEALVGVSRFDEDPRVAGLARVGTFTNLSVEAVVALRPDLVLAQPTAGNQRAFEVLASLGIPVLMLPTETIDETCQSLAAAGRVVGRAKEGRALVEALQATRARIRDRTRELPRPRVLMVVGLDPLVVAGPGSFLEDLLVDAGGTNAAPDAGGAWGVYPLERAVAARPDVILDTSGVAERGELAELPGLSTARWVRPPSSAMIRPGPALGQGLEELAVLLHGPEILAGMPPPSAPLPEVSAPPAPPAQRGVDAPKPKR